MPGSPSSPERVTLPETPMFWCEACGYADIPVGPEDEGRAAGEQCPDCYGWSTHVTAMTPKHLVPADRSLEGLEGDDVLDVIREALSAKPSRDSTLDEGATWQAVRVRDALLAHLRGGEGG